VQRGLSAIVEHLVTSELVCYYFTFLRDFASLLPRCVQCRRGLAMRILSLSPSVRLSVKRVICDKMEERSVQIFISYERSFSLVFWEEEWLVGRPLLPEILGQPAPVKAKSPIFNRYSPVTPQP